MTASSQDHTDKLPGTVFTPRQVRFLKWAVIVMGILLVGGFALVLGTIVYQASNVGKSAPGDAGAALAELPALTLRAGERVSHIALDGNRLAVHVEGPGGAEIRIVDLATGRIVARVPVKSE